MTPDPTGRLVPTPTGFDLILTRTYRASADDVWASVTEPVAVGFEPIAVTLFTCDFAGEPDITVLFDPAESRSIRRDPQR